MKFFYLLANQFVTILLSANTVTTLHFDSVIAYCDRGLSTKALEVVYRRERTSLSLVPKMKNLESNMTCYMKNGEVYVFNIAWAKRPVHKNIVIKDATKIKGGRLVYKTNSFRVFDAGANYYIENLSKTPLTVNETLLEKLGVVSKWDPIIINNKRVYIGAKSE